MTLALSTLLLLQAAPPQTAPPPDAAALAASLPQPISGSWYGEDWVAFAREASAKIRARRPDLVAFWDKPLPNGRRTGDRPRTEEERAKYDREPQAYERAIAARNEGRIEDALLILREGMIDFGSNATALFDEYLYLLARQGQWAEVRDLIGANLEQEQTVRPALLGIALVETGTPAPGLESYLRGYLRASYRVPAEEFERFYPAKGGPATLRRLAWTNYAVSETSFIGHGQSRIWAIDRALALDPTAPIPVRLRVSAILNPAYGEVPIPDRAQVVAEAGRLVSGSLARLNPSDEWYGMLWSELDRFDRKSARKFRQPRTFNTLTGKWQGG